MTPQERKIIEQARNALQTGLVWTEYAKDVVEIDDALTAVNELLAQSDYNATSDQVLMKMPEQEPVAWYIREKDMLTRDANWVAEYPDMCEPLYTTPQQRKPLTDEQVEAIWVEHGLDECDPQGFARAIEAALMALRSKT